VRDRNRRISTDPVPNLGSSATVPNLGLMQRLEPKGSLDFFLR
jgi:hypothetical protein